MLSIFRIDPDVMKAMRWPSDGDSMEIREARFLEFITNDCDAFWGAAGKFTKASDREQ
jgi:hypothetical protein